jgi:hypothetical protein
MAVTLKGSCRCGSVRFSVLSHTPYPYQLCYCSICRKTAGGGGFAINIMGDAETLDVSGRRTLRIYRVRVADDTGVCQTSTGRRHFCAKCASALWLFDPDWPELVHPFASAIDTQLPLPPSKVHLMLRFKPKWVRPQFGPGDQKFALYPKLSIEQWHRRRGLWLE